MQLPNFCNPSPPRSPLPYERFLCVRRFDSVVSAVALSSDRPEQHQPEGSYRVPSAAEVSTRSRYRILWLQPYPILSPETRQALSAYCAELAALSGEEIT